MMKIFGIDSEAHDTYILFVLLKYARFEDKKISYITALVDLAPVLD